MERAPTPAEELVANVAAAHGVSAQQVAVAWLLAHSPVTVPIPGTANAGHLDDNVEAAWLRLTAGELARLDEVATTPDG